MPELPEVETVRRTLTELVVGKTLKEIDIFWSKIIKLPDDSHEFKMMLVGQTIQSIDRRGKFLLFQLTDYTLVSHLRMEGRYGLHQKGEERTKHTHVIFRFEDDTELWYQDVRKFGTMHLFLKGAEEHSEPLLGLGVEPFSELFQIETLKIAFSRTARKVKVVLLDQKAVVGLGNIYVDEALFRAGIHPERLANTIDDQELMVLHLKIKETLQEAVDLGGSSVKSYVNGQGDMGMFQQHLDVYGRKALPCNHCGTEIEKIVVGGRGTHFCPSCQK
ncbi:DNA-formamidopyrimidine glycosylase [Alkalihalobacillus pseudalcaliphilus]|uniref:DNA-formamidopyrimidine glycosylase n=1 Tax=Alkalihalobacillus pseudalcaliphilus TaxID=79884 RepID=UPI00064DE868|nr:DNA-formamidopyrimidine glycosylase [Alkalihalobacillus pseudalcaliphilus]KMK74566.1 5-hydroxymethyluracil DNA glycosylase [Alkalihalobacillus pseudalcaliphilus]